MSFQSSEQQLINTRSLSGPGLIIERLPDHVYARCCKCSRRAKYRVTIPGNGFRGLLCSFHTKLVRALVYDLPEYDPWGSGP